MIKILLKDSIESMWIIFFIVFTISLCNKTPNESGDNIFSIVYFLGFLLSATTYSIIHKDNYNKD